VDPEDQGDDAARALLTQAVPLLERAVGRPIEGVLGDPAPLTAAEDAVNRADVDEIMVVTPPTRLSSRLRLDLASKVAGLGLPMTVVAPGDQVATNAVLD